ncbi:hypothetical protein [Roseomonas sp. WA12]
MSARTPRYRLSALAGLIALAAVPHALAQPAPPRPAAPPGAPASCDPPAGPLAAATCADPAARLADRRRAQAYAALRHQLVPAQREGLETDARSFEAFLIASCRPADPACLARSNEAKREDLRRWLQGPALEEADRPAAEAAALDRRLAARAIPAAFAVAPTANPADTDPRREAIAALQRSAGLPSHGFLDARTAALTTAPSGQASATPVPPATEPGPQPSAPPAASAQAAATHSTAAPNPAVPTPGTAAPAQPASALSDALRAAPPDAVWLPRFPPALNARYALGSCATTASWTGTGLRIEERPVPGENYEIYADPQRFYLLPPGGTARIIEGLPDGTLRLTGTIPPALAARGVTPGAALRRCNPGETSAARPSPRARPSPVR